MPLKINSIGQILPLKLISHTEFMLHYLKVKCVIFLMCEIISMQRQVGRLPVRPDKQQRLKKWLRKRISVFRPVADKGVFVKPVSKQ